MDTTPPGLPRLAVRVAALSALFLFALVLRWHYVSDALPAGGVTGDEQNHGFYGLNLVRHGVYSSTPPGQVPVPDSFRSPGMPLLVAACMKAMGLSDLGWYWLLRRVQCVLGALTAVLFAAFARRWLPWWPAFGVGVATALWPHGIAMTAYALAETLYGFALALAALALARAFGRARGADHALAGLAWSAAGMVNPVALAAVPLLAVLVAARSRRHALLFLAAALSLPLAWSLRDTSTAGRDTSSGRAAINLVQGSWPSYHADWHAAHALGDVAARRRLDVIEAEALAAPQEPGKALAAMGERMRADPAGTATWYLLRKPWLLWDWSIRIGAGDLQVASLSYSAFVSEPAYRALAALARAVNPLLFALALVAVPLALRPRAVRRDAAGTTLAACAAIVVSITALHVLLQAEPRYSIALRGFEIALAATTLAGGWRWLVARRAAATATGAPA